METQTEQAKQQMLRMKRELKRDPSDATPNKAIRIPGSSSPSGSAMDPEIISVKFLFPESLRNGIQDEFTRGHGPQMMIMLVIYEKFELVVKCLLVSS